jgi:RES domain-containing protein
MIVFRLTRTQYARDLSGKGAEQFGGRWNSPGIPVIYTSESRSLALLEALVHFPPGNSPVDYSLLTIIIPDDLPVYNLTDEKLPASWRKFPFSQGTRETGDRLLRQAKYPVLKAPSAIVHGDFNYLINPLHPLSDSIRIQSAEPFPLDVRIR